MQSGIQTAPDKSGILIQSEKVGIGNFSLRSIINIRRNVKWDTLESSTGRIFNKLSISFLWINRGEAADIEITLELWVPPLCTLPRKWFCCWQKPPHRTAKWIKWTRCYRSLFNGAGSLPRNAIFALVNGIFWPLGAEELHNEMTAESRCGFRSFALLSCSPKHQSKARPLWLANTGMSANQRACFHSRAKWSVFIWVLHRGTREGKHRMIKTTQH